MPLVTRIIQAAVPLPEYAAAAKDHALAGDSAIEITHATSLMQLTRVVDQLSQLSTVAAEMFADIAAISDATSNRLHGLQARVQKVKSLLPQMESRIQETAVTNELPTERTEWRTTNSMSLNAFTKATANPTVTSVYYQTCEAPPDLNSLNGFRDDGKPCMRFYSYPEFFVEQWKILMIKEEEAIRKHRKAEKKQNKKDRRKKLTKVRAVDVKRYNSTGELITSTSVDENAPVNQSQSYLSSVKITTEVARENSSNPAESPSPMSPWTEIPSPLAYQGSSQQLAQAQSVPQTKIASLASGAPGGPPPPPSPPAALAPPPPPPPPLKVITGSDGVARPKQAGGVPPPRAPGRNDLLSSIRDGEFKLKKVDERLLTPKSPDAAAGNDVAHILMRRAALEMSDSEDDSGSDDDEWD